MGMIAQKILAFLIAIPPREGTEEPPESRFERLGIAANVIEEVSRGNRLVAASVATMGALETLFDRAWGSCECVGAECDHGRAHGYWQGHRWPSESEMSWWQLCGTDEPPVYAGALRVAGQFRGCQWGDEECLGRRFAMLGGVTSSIPPWAATRARKAHLLAGEIRRSGRPERMVSVVLRRL